MSFDTDLREYLDRTVVFDTMGEMVYVGTLEAVADNGFWLTDADVHDCRDGHARREVYLVNCFRDGVSVNRRRVFVLRDTVCSISRLDDVVVG
ncbi:MAG: hypothetical protein GY842_01030 [bacterium]|nr:hypothetical protein [bacterium]